MSTPEIPEGLIDLLCSPDPDSIELGLVIAKGQGIDTEGMIRDFELILKALQSMKNPFSDKKYPHLSVTGFFSELRKRSKIKFYGFSAPLNQLPPLFFHIINPRELTAAQCSLKQCPAEIKHLKNLITLDLSSNLLDELPAEIGQLENLVYLNLERNPLQKLPAEIGQLKNLQQLYLDWDKVELPPEIGLCSHLTLLSFMLKDRQIDKLHPSIAHLTQVQELHLSCTAMTELPANLWQLASLRTLNISNSLFTKIPAEIAQLRQLESLEADWAKVWLPAQIFDLPCFDAIAPKIQLLDLGSVDADALSFYLQKCTNLVALNLKGTVFNRLPKVIYTLKKLERLEVDWDKSIFEPALFLTSFWKDIAPYVKYLDLSKRLEEHAPPELQHFKKLEKLDMNWARVRFSLEDLQAHYFGKIADKIEKLDLSKRQLSQLPAQLGALSGLRELDVSGNHLQTLPKEIANLKKLECINLSNNQATGWSQGLLSLLGWQSKGISEKEKKRLAELLPSVKISYD